MWIGHKITNPGIYGSRILAGCPFSREENLSRHGEKNRVPCERKNSFIEYFFTGEYLRSELHVGAHVSVAARRRGSAVYYGHDASIIENSNSVQAMTSPETEDGDDAALVSSAIPVERRRLAPVNCRARISARDAHVYLPLPLPPPPPRYFYPRGW